MTEVCEVGQKIVFKDIESVTCISDFANALRSLIMSEVTVFKLPQATLSETEGSDSVLELLAGAEVGIPRQFPVSYSFSGKGEHGLHVDEVSEDLRAVGGLMLVNVHHVLQGRITVDALQTRPGYYSYENEYRTPIGGYNYTLERELTLGDKINTHAASPQVSRGVLEAGDRLFFIERTAQDETGLPNVLHHFYWGSNDRFSQIDRYEIA